MTKAREIDMVLTNKGMERGVKLLLTEAYERLAAIEQQQREIGAYMLQIATIVAQTVDGTTAMRDHIDKMSGKSEDDDDLPSTAQ